MPVVGLVSANPFKQRGVTVSPHFLSSEEFVVWDIDKLRSVVTDYAFPWTGQPPSQPLFSVIVRQYQVTGVSIMHLVDARVREGFQFHSMSVIDDGRLSILLSQLFCSSV